MPSTRPQVTGNSRTHLNSSPSSMEEANPESNYTGVYTGEYRAPFRERIHGIRRLKPVPAPLPRDILLATKQTTPSTTQTPQTPTIPMPSLECPDAPRKGKVSEIRRLTQSQWDILLDREANERVKRVVTPCLVSSRGWGCGCPEPPLFPNVSQQSGHVIPSRRSPLRNSWGPEELARATAKLKPFLDQSTISKDEKDDEKSEAS